jgi:metallo-beta-lactamase family protein
MKISFHGAARSVTGSRHLIDAGKCRILLDCGLFQGRREQADRLNRHLGFDPKSIHTVLLSHAHIDHSGALPILAQGHFAGKVYMTSATADLTKIMLEDSAKIQKGDSAYLNKKYRRRGKSLCRPYYDHKDVQAISRRFEAVPYGKMISVSPRIKTMFSDAGHILGSSSIWLKFTQHHKSVSVLFTGDLGRREMPILQDPEPPPSCDVLILESTYGDRVHEETREVMKAKALTLVQHALTHRSKILVPAFAVGRTQDLVMRIKELVKEGKVPPIPIFIDSPLALKATDIFRHHPECFDEETHQTFLRQGDLFAAKNIRFISTIQESQALNRRRGPCVIIAASGMCEGGRIIHHLKHAIGDERNIIAFVGFQAEHTLGRKLIEEWDTVPIFGIPTRRFRRADGLKLCGLMDYPPMGTETIYSPMSAT